MYLRIYILAINATFFHDLNYIGKDDFDKKNSFVETH